MTWEGTIRSNIEGVVPAILHNALIIFSSLFLFVAGVIVSNKSYTYSLFSMRRLRDIEVDSYNYRFFIFLFGTFQ